MGAVYRKDLLLFFTSPIGYIFIGAFLFIMNLYFYLGNVERGVSDLSGLFSVMQIVIMFLVPLLTMRSFSEEYRQKTDQLLFTGPIPVWQVVLAKFLAVMSVIVIALLITLIWVVIILKYGILNTPSVIGMYIALFFAVTAFIAMGIFTSCLTSSQIIAAILSFTLFFGIFILDSASASLNTFWVKAVISRLSLFSRFDVFRRGLFSLGDLLYYLLFTSTFLLLTIHEIARKND